MTKCTYCKSEQLETVFSLGKIPLGFPLKSSKKDIWADQLELLMCNECKLVQNKVPMPEDHLTSENFYLSKHSSLQDVHNDNFVKEVISYCKLRSDDVIVEIGCGDGGLLKKFKAAGHANVIGVEPSMHEDDNYDFKMITEYFTEKTVSHFKSQNIKPKVIIANYVLDVLTDVDLFMKDLVNSIDDDGFGVFEITRFVQFFESFRIDQFAHLRRSWFTVNFLNTLFKKHNLNLVNIELNKEYRGGTYRVTVSKTGIPCPNLKSFLQEELAVLNTDYFTSFREKLARLKSSSLSYIQEKKASGQKIYGYGGGLKASTLINWLGLTDNDMESTIDADEFKVGKYVPVSNIPIMNLQTIKNKKVDVILLALDHEKEIMNNLMSTLATGSKVIKLLPSLSESIVK